jgi:WD40 repeat protein
VRVWDGKTGRETIRVFHGAALSALAVTPDGRRAFSGGNDVFIHEWELPAER